MTQRPRILARPSSRSMRIATVVALAWLSQGCGAVATTGRLARARDAMECARVPEEVRSAPGRTDHTSGSLTVEMPDAVRRVAEVARIDDATLADRIGVIERVLLLRTELDSAEAELGCLDDQLENLQEELEERESQFELTFTLASIAVGALAGVVGGILQLTDPDGASSPIVGIAGGVASASLGVVAFWPPRGSVELVHRRNLLRTIAAPGPLEGGALSGFIARSLDAPRRERSPRELLRAAWRDILSELDPASRAILFGDGGTYDRDMLRLREVALEELELEIEQIRQDLELLLRFLYARPPLPPSDEADADGAAR